MGFLFETGFLLETALCFLSLHDVIKNSMKGMKKQANFNITASCKTRISAIKDAMEILSGKWKFHILGTLLQNDKMRFMDLMREVEGIGAKMLSKELQDMEMNRLVSRTVLDTKPITVEYKITEYGQTLEPIIDEIANWGVAYRKSIYEASQK